MKKHRLVCFLLILLAVTAGCTGIPLRSMPRLLSLGADLQTANPAEIMLAVQVDRQLNPPESAVPELVINIRPSTEGAFAPINKRLPMRLVRSTGGELGLQPARAGRHWLVYSLLRESQTELIQLQHVMRDRQKRPQDQGGMKIAVGIAQENVALSAPALASSRWESWLQLSRAEGFFELWSGTTDDLLRAGGR